MMWLLDLMVSNPKSKTRVHISEKCVRFIGKCIHTRSEKIEKAGLSVKVSYFIPCNGYHDYATLPPLHYSHRFVAQPSYLKIHLLF
jgi:hypothetical protein